MLQNSMPTWLSTLLKSTCSSLSISVNMADANLCVWKLRCVSPIVSNLTSRTYTLLQVSQSASCVDSFIHLFKVVVFIIPCFLICCVLQRSATIWHWMLCVQRPGPHLLTWTIKVIVGLPGASPSKTERLNVCKKPSWCRQVLWSFWGSHGLSYGFLPVKKSTPKTLCSAHNTQHSNECRHLLWLSFMKVIFLSCRRCKWCFEPERRRDKALRSLQSRKILILTWNRPVLIKACQV